MRNYEVATTSPPPSRGEEMKYDCTRHHRRSTRVKGYDYSAEGMYYVTICTRERQCMLGNVVEDEMKLNEFGKLVELCWLEIPQDFTRASLDIHQVMPNHIHGIIRILAEDLCRDLINEIPTKNNQIASGHNEIPEGNNANSPLMKNPKQTLGKIIRSFKAKATKKIHDAGHPDFGWQSRFYDHIIRDGKDLDRIRRYILDNPAKWMYDDNHPGNIRMENLHEGEGNFSALD
jgi:putative transposase